MLQLLLWGFTFLSCSKKIEIIYLPSIATENTATGKQLICDTTITGTWDGGGKTFRNNDFKVHGTGTMQNWILDIPITQNVFDSSINFKSIQTYDGRFSPTWLGASATNTDNWWNIQKSMNISIANNLECHLPGNGVYRYYKTLESSVTANGNYQFCKLYFTGDASYWDNGSGTTLQYTGITGAAINFQLNKGSVFDHIAVKGLWIAPLGTDSAYYSLTESNYKDRSIYNLPDTYSGVTIDYWPPLDGKTRSGSTGIHMDNISIGGFAKGLAFSQNGLTLNDDANSFDYIHFFDNKWCIVTGQPQEKGTSIDHIYSWGSCYNVFKNFGAGNYSLNVANIAGRCIEPVQAQIGRWFSSSISNWFCESIGRVCTISALMPFSFTDCHFDFSLYNKTRTVINSNTTDVSFTHCTFRFYDGTGGNVNVHSAATFNGCNYYFGNVVYK